MGCVDDITPNAHGIIGIVAAIIQVEAQYVCGIVLDKVYGIAVHKGRKHGVRSIDLLVIWGGEIAERVLA
ncbi:MAG: hypothetical protein A2496_06760 [Burkholderiales bacterium RIFOXYC12_FULL_60_6]|nr:MAG: hypothetical protein A2496_06760 [Burkholderiales bacterium RIFOXYC12_FULL_60_6]